MAIQPHHSESNEISPGPRDREYADPLPPPMTGGRSRESRTEWPTFTVVLAIVMTMVVTLSTPWAAKVRSLLFPPHQKNALENRTSSTVPALPEAAQSEPEDGRTTPGLVTHDRPTDAKQGAHELGDKYLPGAPSADVSQKTSRASFVLLVNGREKVVEPGETLSIARSDELVIHDYKDMDQADRTIKV
ncbi:MAG: hypothetical protein R3231_04985, partial [bacterium]|nr:hypothetical protein [bacterium]